MGFAEFFVLVCVNIALLALIYVRLRVEIHKRIESGAAESVRIKIASFSAEFERVADAHVTILDDRIAEIKRLVKKTDKRREKPVKDSPAPPAPADITREVSRLAADGRTPEDIAATLGISVAEARLRAGLRSAGARNEVGA